MSRVAGRHRMATMVGLNGAVLGVVAGILQASIGSRIPEWTGAKSSPVTLGLLTIGLSALAGWAAIAQRSSGRSTWARIGCAIGLVGPGLLCLTTVGRLWYLPAALLLVAGVLTIDSWKDTARAVADDWYRVLLTALGGFEILMAVVAPPLLTTLGIIGGICLIAASWLRSAPRFPFVVLIVIGTVPFAAVGWTAVVPVVLAVVAVFVAVPVIGELAGRPVPHREALSHGAVR